MANSIDGRADQKFLKSKWNAKAKKWNALYY
jgi:hypothetical protein